LPLFCLAVLLLSSCQTHIFDIVETTDQFAGDEVMANNCDYGGEIKGVRAIDRYTVEFELCNPDLTFPNKLAFPVFAIQDSEFLNFSGGNSELLSNSANGTGPFFVKDYEAGQYIILGQKSEYWGVPAKMDSIEFRWVKDQGDRQEQFLAGLGSGMVDYVGPDSANINVVYRSSISTSYLGFNNQVAPFDNPLVRKAIALGIDRERILDLYYSEGAVLADQIIPVEIFPGYSSGLNWYDSSIHEAENLLKNSDFDKNQEIVLYYSEKATLNIPAPEQIAREIKGNLAMIGINLRLEQKTDEEFQQLFKSGEMGFFFTEISPEIPEAVSFYNPLFSDQSKTFGLIDGEIVDAINAASRTEEEQTRQGYYDFVNQSLRQDIIIIPLVNGSSTLAFQDDVQNVFVGPMNENFPEMVVSDSKLTFLLRQEPQSLWPADEVDQDSFTISSLIFDNLVSYDYGTATLKPELATSWEANGDLTVWTFYLRYDVKFLNGETFDANDVVASFSAMWDEDDVNHTGRTGDFFYFKKFFGEFLSNN